MQTSSFHRLPSRLTTANNEVIIHYNENLSSHLPTDSAALESTQNVFLFQTNRIVGYDQATFDFITTRNLGEYHLYVEMEWDMIRPLSTFVTFDELCFLLPQNIH